MLVASTEELGLLPVIDSDASETTTTLFLILADDLDALLLLLLTLSLVCWKLFYLIKLVKYWGSSAACFTSSSRWTIFDSDLSIEALILLAP